MSEEIAWAAGFLEGEGSFFCSARGYLVCQASQVDAECLEKLKDLFGGSICGDNMYRNNGRSKPQFYWRTSGEKAACVMEVVRPYMSARRLTQIEKALEAWHDARSKLPPGGHSTRRKLEAWQVIEIRDRHRRGELQWALADEYGVSISSVSRIILKRTWASV